MIKQFRKTITITVDILAENGDEATDYLPNSEEWHSFLIINDNDDWKEVGVDATNR